MLCVVGVKPLNGISGDWIGSEWFDEDFYGACGVDLGSHSGDGMGRGLE